MLASLLLSSTASANTSSGDDWTDITAQFEVTLSNPRRDRRSGQAEVIITALNQGAPLAGASRMRLTGLTPQSVSFLAAGSGDLVLPMPDRVEAGATLRYSVRVNGGASVAFAFDVLLERADATPPDLVRTWPEDGATEVPRNTVFKFIYGEQLDPATLGVNSVQVTASDSNGGTVAINGTAELVRDGTEVRFVADDDLPPSVLHTASITGLADLSGNPIPPADIQFTTSAELDKVRPQNLGMIPPDGQVDVPIGTVVAAHFDKPIDPATIPSGLFRLAEASNVDKGIPGRIVVSEDWRTLRYVPSKPLAVGRRYFFVASLVKDLYGNRLEYRNLWFTTGFETDASPPIIVATSFDQGTANVPLNVQLHIKTDEALGFLTESSFSLRSNGREIAITTVVDAARRTVAFIPFETLDPLATHTLTVSDLYDLSGNRSEEVFTLSFTTGSETDVSRPSIVARSPGFRHREIPADAPFEFRFSEPIDPATISDGAITVENVITNRFISGTVTLSESNTRLTFQPDSPLTVGDRYHLLAFLSRQTETKDLAGNRVSGSALGFFDAVPVQTVPTRVFVQSVADGSEDVPVDARVSFRVDPPMNDVCTIAPATTIIEGEESVPYRFRTDRFDSQYFSFSSITPLKPSTQYQLQFELCRMNGTVDQVVDVHFTTRADASRDTEAPELLGTDYIAPSAAVPNGQVILLFNEPVDVARTEDIEIRAREPGSALFMARGTFEAEGKTLIFTPEQPLPGDTEIQINGREVYDWAGNQAQRLSATGFTTPYVDTVAPFVTSISPESGTEGVSRNLVSTIHFSEPMEYLSLLDANAFFYWSKGLVYRPDVTVAWDRRSVTLRDNVTDDANVAILALPVLRDMAGNAMESWALSVVRTSNPDAGDTPLLFRTVPDAGALVTDLDSIIVFTNSPIDQGSLAERFYVAANGVLVDGDIAFFAESRGIRFTPLEPLPDGALIQVFLRDGISDVHGTVFPVEEVSFRTSPKGSIPGSRPLLEVAPPSAVTWPLNPVFEARYSEPLDPTQVSGQWASLSERFGDRIVAVDATLADNDTRLVLKPRTLLQPNTSYTLYFNTRVVDLDGQSPIHPTSFNFSTGTDVDDRNPTVIATSPGSGFEAVPLTAEVTVRFSEPVSIVGVGDSAWQTITQERGAAELRLSSPGVPVFDDSEVTVSLEGVKDLAGNPLEPWSVTYNSANVIDEVRPQVVARSPTDGADNVPVDAKVRVTFSESINPLSFRFRTLSFFSWTTATDVEFTFELSPDGMTLEFVPLAPLTPGHTYGVWVNNYEDLSGNIGSFSQTTFRVATAPDTAAPVVEKTTLTGRLDPVPINPQLRVRFSESVDMAKLIAQQQVRLRNSSGEMVQTHVQQDFDARTVLLVPVSLLDALSEYTLEVSGVEDSGGNTMEGVFQQSFATSGEFDVLASWLLASPFSAYSNFGLSGVPTNAIIEVLFGEDADPVRAEGMNTPLFDVTDRVNVPGRYTLTANRFLRFEPDAPLAPNRTYRFDMNEPSDTADIAGNPFTGYALAIRTASGPDFEPPSIADTDLPTDGSGISPNADIAIEFSEAVSELCLAGAFRLETASGESVAFALAQESRTRWRVNPVADLMPAQDYVLTLSGVCDFARNTMPEVSLTFRTL